MREVLLVLMGLLLGGQAPTDSSTPMQLSPLSPEERTALETAIDGRDHQESAFDALVTALQRVSPERIAVDSIPSWSIERIVAAIDEPDGERGEPVLLTGRLEQSVVLERPWSSYCEWFVRLADGTAVAVYVPREDDVEPGERVHLAARFYKRIEAIARDGATHRYAAFVGRSVVVVPDSNPAWFIVMFIVVLLLGWLFLQVVSRRSRTSGRILSTSGREPAEKEVDSSGLPADPVAALDELARRHDDQERKGDS